MGELHLHPPDLGHCWCHQPGQNVRILETLLMSAVGVAYVGCHSWIWPGVSSWMYIRFISGEWERRQEGRKGGREGGKEGGTWSPIPDLPNCNQLGSQVWNSQERQQWSLSEVLKSPSTHFSSCSFLLPSFKILKIWIDHLSHPRSCYRTQDSTINKTDKNHRPLGTFVLVGRVRQDVKKKKKANYISED